MKNASLLADLKTLTDTLELHAQHPVRDDPTLERNARHTLLLLASVVALQLALDPTAASMLGKLDPLPTEEEARSLVARIALGVSRDIILITQRQVQADEVLFGTLGTPTGTQTAMMYMESGFPRTVVMDQDTGAIVRRMFAGEDVLRDLAAQVSA